jgi:hypothetical protein
MFGSGTALNPSLEILKTLTNHGVDYLVVGGFAAVTLGAPIMTWDVDVVHSTEAENLKRLTAALGALDATYKYRPEFRPNESHLVTQGHQLLNKSLGQLDVPGAIGKGRTYEDLLPHTELVALSPELRVRVLDLERRLPSKKKRAAKKTLRYSRPCVVH